MIRKKWLDGEPVLSVETEDEFWKALTTGETVELTGELGERIGLMAEDVGTRGRDRRREVRSERLENGGPRSSLKPRSNFVFHLISLHKECLRRSELRKLQ